MKYTSKIVFFLFILLIFCCSVYLFISTKDKQVTKSENISLYIKSFKIDDGWGFDLYKNEKKTIHQVHIPAVNGIQFFRTEEDAKKVAEIMKFKIEKNIFPPSVSLTELDSLKIYYLQ